jgi:hypothetical protein
MQEKTVNKYIKFLENYKDKFKFPSRCFKDEKIGTRYITYLRSIDVVFYVGNGYHRLDSIKISEIGIKKIVEQFAEYQIQAWPTSDEYQKKRKKIKESFRHLPNVKPTELFVPVQFTTEDAIAHLKSIGYRVMKPVNQWEEI